MDLRSFHIFFIVVAALMLFGVGAWALEFASTHQGTFLIFGWGNIVSGILVTFYGFYFVRKSRRMGSEK